MKNKSKCATLCFLRKTAHKIKKWTKKQKQKFKKWIRSPNK